MTGQPQRELVETVKAGMRDGVLLLQQCDACGSFQFLPRVMCAHCNSRAVEFVEASLRGTVHTFSVVHRAPTENSQLELPYTLAVVRLSEGPMIMAHVDRADQDLIACDASGTIGFLTLGRETVAVFRSGEENHGTRA